MQKEQQGNVQPLWLRQAPITIIGVLVLGIIGSTLYDLLVKPGLTSFGRLVLDLITLESTTLRNAAYSSAALDPTPVSALALLQAAVFLASFPAIKLIAQTRVDREEDAIEEKLASATEEEKKEKLAGEINRLRRKARFFRFAFWLSFVPSIVALYIAFAVHNQSVVVWRVFNADMAILGPIITPDEQLTLHAQFASMETSDDYKAIRKQMHKFADPRAIQLKNIETW